MARKRSSVPASTKKKPSKRGPSALPPPAPERPRDRSYMARWREQQTSEYDNEKWAKTELALGRFAQGAGLAAGFVLWFTAFIAAYLTTSPSPPIISSFRRPEMALWILPLGTSFAIAGLTVARKLGPYRAGFRDAHFISSIAAFLVSIFFLTLALLDHLYVLDLGWFVPWMYLGSVLGFSLAFVSLALTWEGFGWRKDASIAASLAVPFPLLFLPFLGTPSLQAMMLVYASDMLFVVFAGSMLHLIASSGEATQREILKASDSKVTLLKRDMLNKLQALEYKDKAYVEREAHLDAKEKDLLEIEGELDSRAKELNAVQVKLDAQGNTYADLESRLAKMRAEVETKVEEFTLKDKDLKVARGQIEASRQNLAEREQALADRDKEVKRLQIEMTSRERVVEAKATELTDLEARLKKEDASVDARRNEIIRKEKDLQLQESEVKLKMEQLEAHQATESTTKISELKDWESKVLEKEREIGQREVTLQSLREDLDQRQVDGDAYAEALQQERDRLAAREQELNAREKLLSDVGSEAEEKHSEIDRRWKEVIDAQKRLEAREAEYNSLFKNAKLREADFSATKEDVARKMAAQDAREAKIKEWQTNLGAETKKLQEKFRELLAREKSIQQKESDLSLKELEITERARESRAIAGGPGPKEMDEDQVFDMREKALREREDEFKRRMYQREKEMEAREMALKEQLKTAAAAGPAGETPEAPVAVADRGDRLRTGTPRLDDLLYGGFPMNGNILFVGPAFVGKEVAILNFIAEGLKANVPAIIVTTSKPPVEIAKEMAPVLPTFMEYEQLGLVRWIDASGTTPTQKLARNENTFRVPNATDFEGILKAVNDSDEEFRQKGSTYFRFAFLSLSSSLSQADDKTALGFVQRFVNRLRQSKCVATFALERGMHTDQQVESLQQLMDGALIFRQEKSKTLISVVGVGEVQTRDWVPYKFTNKALMIGSFQLERIR